MAEHETEEGGQMLPVVEERLVIGKERVVSSRVRVVVATRTQDEPVTAELRGETVEVSRVPVDREVGSVPEVRIEGDVTIIPVIEEVVVIERRLVLREEVHLRRVASVETVTTSVPLRRQHVVIERDDVASSFTPNSEDESDERL